MKRQHLLRVDDGAEAFAGLVAAIREAGGRVGWLELAPPAPVPPALEAAAAGGVLRAVAVGGGRSVAVKPIRGEPVLRDVLREHFRGCVLVLVAGAAAAELPWLAPRADGWLLRLADGRSQELGTEELVAALRRPRPWGIAAGSRP